MFISYFSKVIWSDRPNYIGIDLMTRQIWDMCNTVYTLTQDVISMYPGHKNSDTYIILIRIILIYMIYVCILIRIILNVFTFLHFDLYFLLKQSIIHSKTVESFKCCNYFNCLLKIWMYRVIEHPNNWRYTVILFFLFVICTSYLQLFQDLNSIVSKCSF